MDMGEGGDPGSGNNTCKVPEAAVLGVLQKEQGGQDGWREESKKGRTGVNKEEEL